MTSKQSSNYGKKGEVVAWRIQKSSLELEKYAKCFLRNLSGSCHGGGVCGRDRTHARLQSLISVEYPSDND